MEHTIHLWDAIREMREVTGNDGTFSMTFMSYDQSRQRSQGPITVHKAKLRPGTTKDQNRFADYMLNFLDVDLNLPRQMYYITLMEYNGRRVTIK